MKLNIQLSIEEANAILGVLSQHPYNQVFQLIQTIQSQAAPQVGAIEQARRAASEEEQADGATSESDVGR